MGKLAAAGFAVIGGFVLALVLMVVVLVAGEQQQASGGGGGINLEAVPEPWREAVLAASQTCPAVAGPLIPAQIEAESQWNPRAVSPVGAQGLTQFMPATWATYGVDGDGDGKADPFNPLDAIASQGNYMCALVPEVQDLADNPDELTDLLLAAYNAGPGAVQRYRGIPPYSETTTYVKRIRGFMAKYEGAPAIMAGTGGWVEPIDAPRGTPFRKSGPAWRWKGWHTGADWPAPAGTPVRAAGPGTITSRGWDASYGNAIEIDHGMINDDRITTLYAHFSSFANVGPGQRVEAGQVIGYAGDTGNSFGSHLHMEVRRNWKGGGSDDEFVDPFAWLDANKGASQAPAGFPPQAANNSPVRAAALTVAAGQVGTPYSWGGGGTAGPSTGIGSGADTVGYDCSSLVQFAYHQASNGDIQLPRVTRDQVKQGTPVNSLAHALPGDLVFFDTDTNGDWDHVGIYAGSGRMVHAPRPGKSVETITITTGWYADKPQTIRRIA